MSTAALLARGMLVGDFRIEGVLRRIPHAVVYEATQVSLDRRVSLTVMDPPPAEDQRFVERFGRESRLLAGLEHPHIATVIAAGRLEHGLFVATGSSPAHRSPTPISMSKLARSPWSCSLTWPVRSMPRIPSGSSIA